MSGTGLAPGWYPDGPDVSHQRWWDGTAWTGYRRVSRFPAFVERRGKPEFRGRRLFPSGDGKLERNVRLSQGLIVGALVFLVAGLPLGWVYAVLVAGELSLLPLLIPALTALVLMLAALVPLIRVQVIVGRAREALARGEFYDEFGPDGAPRSAPAAQAKPPGW